MAKTSRKILSSLLVSGAVVLAGIFASTSPVHAAQSTVNLGTATPFAILAGTPNITDAGNASVILGNVGLSPASGAGIGLNCSQVTGTIYSVDAAGPLPCRITNGPLLVGAKNDLTTAYTDASGRTPVTTVPTELGGTTKTAGVYDSTSTTFGITAGAGALVLDGQNDPSSVFIFNANFNGTGLTVGSGSTISLINGAQACNVFWRVDTASINTTANFKGTVLALNSISVNNGATIEGRLLARNGNVTLNTDTITVPTCASTTGGSGSTSVPGLPNTGSNQNILPLVASTLGASTVAILVMIFIRKKRTN
jgi:LPXTG-motif cell wall-anchored protein